MERRNDQRSYLYLIFFFESLLLCWPCRVKLRIKTWWKMFLWRLNRPVITWFSLCRASSLFFLKSLLTVNSRSSRLLVPIAVPIYVNQWMVKVWPSSQDQQQQQKQKRVQFIRNIVSYHVYDRRKEKRASFFLLFVVFISFFLRIHSIHSYSSFLLFLFIHSSSSVSLTLHFLSFSLILFLTKIWREWISETFRLLFHILKTGSWLLKAFLLD